MEPAHLAYLVLFAVTSVALGSLTVRSARNQRANAAPEFLAILLATTAWAMAITVQLAAADDLAVQVATLYASNLANHALWMATVCFAFAFTNHRRYLRHPGVLALLGAGVLIELAILTNPLHHLVWSDYAVQQATVPHLAYARGPAFVAAYVVGYAGTVLAVGHLVRHALGSNRFIRRQTGLFVLGVAIAAVGNLAYQLGFAPVDTTPIGLLGFAVAATVAIYHYQLFEITPVAYAHVVDEVANAIVVVDDNDRIAIANPAATALFDVTDDEVVGLPVDAVLPEAVLQHVRATPDGSTVVDLADDGTDPYRVTTSAIQPEHDSVRLGTAVVLEAVPEFAEQRARLERKTAQLERQNAQLERFAGTVSHDLRNPLTVAQGYAAMLDADGVPEAAKLLEAFDRMEEIIADVLALAREGRAIDDVAPVSLASVARDAWSSIDAPAADLSVAAETRVEADPERLQTLFENLFRNAVEHGGDAVSITVDPLPDGDGFAVTDDGVGIDDAAKDDVLEYGYTTCADGTGIGLSIVQQIAEAHGWTLTVTDTPGGGTTFVVRTHPRPGAR